MMKRSSEGRESSVILRNGTVHFLNSLDMEVVIQRTGQITSSLWAWTWVSQVDEASVLHTGTPLKFLWSELSTVAERGRRSYLSN